MGLITWADTLANKDNKTATHIINMKNDITTVINGNLTDSNFPSTAALAESKFSFNTTTGHNHDGTNSKSLVLSIDHYRKGLTIYGDDDDNIAVYPGTIEIAGDLLNRTAVSGDIAIANAGNWISGATGTSQWIYVYAYNEDDEIEVVFSDEAPDLSDTSDNTAELPLRYQLYAGKYHRCLGAVFQDAAGDLCWGHASSEGLFYTNFDASSVCIMNGLCTGSDQTFNTIWTPKWVKILYSNAVTTPAAGDDTNDFIATQLMLDTNWYATELNVRHEANTHVWQPITTNGAVDAITAQSAGTAGSFSMDGGTDGKHIYMVAYTDLV